MAAIKPLIICCPLKRVHYKEKIKTHQNKFKKLLENKRRRKVRTWNVDLVLERPIHTSLPTGATGGSWWCFDRTLLLALQLFCFWFAHPSGWEQIAVRKTAQDFSAKSRDSLDRLVRTTGSPKCFLISNSRRPLRTSIFRALCWRLTVRIIRASFEQRRKGQN